MKLRSISLLVVLASTCLIHVTSDYYDSILDSSSSSCSPDTSSQERDFYFWLDGVGPTSGDGTEAAAVTTEWALEKGWSKYLVVSSEWSTTAEQCCQTRKLGWVEILTANSSPRWRARRASYKNEDESNLTQAMTSQFQCGLNEDEVVWQFIMEDDSAGTGFSQDVLVATRSSGYTNGVTRLSSSNISSMWHDYIDEALDAISAWPSVRKVVRFGFPTTAHSLAKRTKPEILLIERANDDIGSLFPAISYIRGASKQFHSDFGIDLSVWWGVINGCVSKYPSSLHARALYMSYAAGSKIVQIEGCGWIDENTKEPYEIANAADDFGNFIYSVLSPEKRGTHDVILGVIVPYTLGWSENPPWSSRGASTWNYAKAEGSRISGSMDGIFAHMFPGVGVYSGYYAFPFGHFKNNDDPPPSPFARSAITEKFAESSQDVWMADSSVSFGVFESRNDAHDWFSSTEHSNPADYRPMEDTSFGDTIDILVDNSFDGDNVLTTDLLSAYPVLLYHGDNLTSLTVKVLSQYVEQGGQLIVSVGAVGVSAYHQNLTGVNFTGNIFGVRTYEWINLEFCNSFRQRTHSRSCSVNEPLSIAEAVKLGALGDDVESITKSVPDGTDVVTRRRLGKGSVYTVMGTLVFIHTHHFTHPPFSFFIFMHP